ncbi:LacI family DNA-binding transcriptional regulator [Victivallis sp. Marseille-Q1083]|uniref:LacI family DNA-binding transcriptional regulator n=1 Tax=Victivallis sp. Marseille-Q1083 TaxID=2717288 RepID=UPI0015899048|nr:LacI family DNA-binding transcriptional regulator [Victivallis sp. Marseille-Q1083]
MAVTLKDVARHANVGVSAASYVLSGSGLNKVSEATRARIFAAATKLGYRVNHAGRMLHGGRSRTIGVVECVRSVPLFAELMQLVCNELAMLGYRTFYQVTDAWKEELLGEFVSRGVDGIIIADYGFDLKLPMADAGTPMVVFSGGAADIRIDLEYGAWLAVRHLIEHGHTRIGYLYPDTGRSDAKLAGWRRALAEAGIDARDEWLIKVFPTPRWREAIDRAVDREKVTAIGASCDDYAVKLMKYLTSRGLRVPEDIAVFGYDGMRYVEDLAVPLSTVVQPVERVAFSMCHMMMKKLDRETPVVPEVLLPALHLGRSCGCRPQSTLSIDWSSTSINLLEPAAAEGEKS